MELPHRAEAPVESEAKTRRHFLRELVETAVLALVIYAGLRLLVQSFRIDGTSMEPNLHEGQHVLVAKWSYWLRPPQRGEIVVFAAPQAGSRDLIKRIVGLPGEAIRIAGGRVYVDDQPLSEPYARLGSESGGPWVLGADEVFVMGDNRERSQDSRSWGPLPTSAIVGKGLVIYWPPRMVGLVPHAES